MTFTTRFAHRLSLFVTIAAVLAASPFLRAQVEEPVGAGQPAAGRNADDGARGMQPEGDSDSILSMVLGSGMTGVAFMGVLGLFSLIAGTVAVERAMNMRKSRVLPADFVDQMRRFLRRPSASPEPLDQLCATSRAPVATVLAAGLLRRGRPLLEVEKSMEDAAAREMAELRARIRPLSVVGTTAPLVGLLGTVVGMIIAFHTASQAGLGKAELLAKGIYMALLTTAGGLSIAIPALLLAAYFNGRIERFFREMDRDLMEVMPLLASSQPPVDRQDEEEVGARAKSERNPLMSAKV